MFTNSLVRCPYAIFTAKTALYTHRLVWKTAASLFKYILPATFGLAAIFSFRWAEKRR